MQGKNEYWPGPGRVRSLNKKLFLSLFDLIVYWLESLPTYYLN